MSLEKLLREREGFKDYVYEDTMGNPTIGTGHKLPEKYRSMIYDPDKKGSKKVKPFTNKQLEEFFQEDIKIAKNSAMANFNNFNTFPVSVQEGLINQAFQLGQGKQALFTEMKKGLDSGDYNKAMVEALDSNWNTQTPKRSNDLANIFREQIPSGQEVNLVPEQTSVPLMRPSESNTVPNQNNIIMEGIKQDMNQQAVPQPKSFNQAFGEARKQQGSGGTFEWNGNSYSTNIAGEVPAVAEPMFPREEFVPTVPPRVTSTADSRINVPPFEGLEIPELGFNNGTKGVPGYRNGTGAVVPKLLKDKIIQTTLPPYAYANDEIIETQLSPYTVPSNIDEDRRNLQEMAIINAVNNNYSVPPYVNNNDEIIQTTLPPYAYANDEIIQTTLPPYVGDNDDIIQTTLPKANGPMNFSSNAVNSLDNRVNAPETERQINTRENRIINDVKKGDALRRTDLLEETYNPQGDSAYTSGFVSAADAGELPANLVNSDISKIKEVVNIEDQFPTPGNDLMYYPPELTNNDKGTSSLVSETGLRIVDGIVVDAQGNPIADVPPPPPEAKNKIEGLLKDYFGLEGNDLIKTLGYYLASRATGASHAGSMRWAGGVTLDSAAKREERNRVTSVKNAADQRQIEALVKAGYTRSQATAYVETGVDDLLDKPKGNTYTGEFEKLSVEGIPGLTGIAIFRREIETPNGKEQYIEYTENGKLISVPQQDFEDFIASQKSIYPTAALVSGKLTAGDIVKMFRDNRSSYETSVKNSLSGEKYENIRGLAPLWVASAETFYNERNYSGDVRTSAEINKSILTAVEKAKRDSLTSPVNSLVPYLRDAELTIVARSMGQDGIYGKTSFKKRDEVYDTITRKVGGDPSKVKDEFMGYIEDFNALKKSKEEKDVKAYKLIKSATDKETSEFYTYLRGILDI